MTCTAAAGESDVERSSSPFDLQDMGGLEAVEEIVTRFYDKVYAHPDLRHFFADIRQERQSRRLIGFIKMTTRSGWMNRFNANYLGDAHAHLDITGDAFDVRHSLLKEAVLEQPGGDELIDAWTSFDEYWRPFVVQSRDS